MSDDDFDDAAFGRVMKAISGASTKKVLKTKKAKIDAGSLLSHITKNRTSTDIARKKLGIDGLVKNAEEGEKVTEEGEGKKELEKKKKEKKLKKKDKNGAEIKKKILVPVKDKRAKAELEGTLAFGELKKDLTTTWTSLVDDNRVVDQLIFPLTQPEGLVLTPKELEIKYTKEEMEVKKAMDLRMAKEKIDQVARMKALMSITEAKNRYTKKIKSKKYHRILKREKRKQTMKEFDELVVRDPEAAKEKLAELDNQRIIERGELKHRAKNKFQQTIVKHAGKNPEVQKMLDEHLRLGRELKAKVSMKEGEDSGSEDDDEDEIEVEEKDLLQEASREAAAETSSKTKNLLEAFLADPQSVQAKVTLAELRAQKRIAAAEAGSRQIETKDLAQPIFEMEEKWNDGTGGKKKKLKKKKTETKKIKEVTDVDEYDEKLKHAVSEAKAEEREKALATIDPNKFLELSNNELTQVSSDLVEKMDEFDEDTARVINEAFKDDDVVGDFAVVKDDVQETQRAKDVDLTLLGWGDWVGPGMSQKRKRKQFVVKANNKRRKDGEKNGLIISELAADHGIGKLQPRNLPFPFTRVEDYETILRQPLGYDWNPAPVRDELCKKAVVMEAGRAILPINKKDLKG